jgi:hypothetical protein
MQGCLRLKLGACGSLRDTLKQGQYTARDMLPTKKDDVPVVPSPLSPSDPSISICLVIWRSVYGRSHWQKREAGAVMASCEGGKGKGREVKR